MTFQKKQGLLIPIILFAATLLFPGCLTPKKVDRFVGKQFNNELPNQNKNKNPDISVTSNIPYRSDNISTTELKIINRLSHVFYCQWDYRNTCTLNPAIAVNNFTKSISLQVNKGLNKKLMGQKLELTIEQLPTAFAFNDRTKIILLYQRDITSIQPDLKDLIVSYKVLQNGSVIKSGKISIKNNEQNKNLRAYQSWKSSISEYLTQYNYDITNMTKTFVNKLILEI